MCVCLLTRSFPFQINYFLIYLFSTFFDGFFVPVALLHILVVCVLSLPTHHAAALAFVDKCYSRKIIVETDSLGRFTISLPTCTQLLHLPRQCLKKTVTFAFTSLFLFNLVFCILNLQDSMEQKYSVCLFTLNSSCCCLGSRWQMLLMQNHHH